MMRTPRKKSRRNKLKIYLLAIFLFSCFWFGFGFFRWGRKGIWSEHQQLNIVINSKPVIIASYVLLPEKLLKLVSLPEDAYIDAVGGRGFYRLESLFNLGQLDDWGGGLLTSSIQEYFGLSIDAYISIPNLSFPNEPEKIIESLNVILMSLFKSKGETNLSKGDLLRLWWFNRSIGRNQMTIFNLNQAATTSLVTLGDETKVSKIDPEKSDQIISQLAVDKEIEREGFSIAILNGTSSPGLAQQAARLIGHLGGDIVEIGNWERKTSHCQIFYPDSKRRSYTVSRLTKIFACQWKADSLDNHRADIILIVGEKYLDKLTKKTADF